MNGRINDVKNFDKTMYEIIKNKTLHMPAWQRTYDWTVPMAKVMLDDIFVSVDSGEDGNKGYKFMGNIIVHNANNGTRVVVADGHTRLLTFTIFLKAFLDTCAKKKFYVNYIPLCNVQYDLDVANKQYQAFLASPVSHNSYGCVYVMACQTFNSRLHSEEYANKVAKTFMNRVMVGVTVCNTEEQAQQAFVERNAYGKTLTDKQMISSYLNVAMETLHFPLDYEYEDLKELLEGYYYCVLGTKATATFKEKVIEAFIHEYVTHKTEGMEAFAQYLERVNAFKKTMWYSILKKLGDKNVMLGYVLAGMGYDFNSYNEVLENFLYSIVVFDISIYARNCGGGGVISNRFKKLRQEIGSGDPDAKDFERDNNLNTIHKNFISWVEHNKHKFKAFDKNHYMMCLDTIKTEYQQAFMMFLFKKHNRNALPINFNFDHTYPQKPNKVWLEMWTLPNSKREEMIRSLGNCVMFDETWNNAMGNACIQEKKVYYRAFFDKNDAYHAIEFNCELFEKDGKKYLDARRNALASDFLESSKIGKILTSNR